MKRPAVDRRVPSQARSGPAPSLVEATSRGAGRCRGQGVYGGAGRARERGGGSSWREG